jgi:hypothetical protein
MQVLQVLKKRTEVHLKAAKKRRSFLYFFRKKASRRTDLLFTGRGYPDKSDDYKKGKEKSEIFVHSRLYKKGVIGYNISVRKTTI